jgi:branched-subunit amino acid aminotransferase/4-amino-4-deoxychorismate lyase
MSMSPERTNDEFLLYEALRWEPIEGYFPLERHLRRLQQSAFHFRFVVDIDSLRKQLSAYSQQFDPTPRKVRLELAANGTVVLMAEPAKPSLPVLTALASEPIDSRDEFLRHKTSRRAVFHRALAAHPGAQDVLLWNERRELSETCFGNLVLELHGCKLTPPVSAGLLPGTFRAHLLDAGLVEEQVLPVEAIYAASAAFLVNSVRSWCPLRLTGFSGEKF